MRDRPVLHAERKDKTELIFYFVKDQIEPLIREILRKTNSIFIENSSINTYEELNSKLPVVGDNVGTPDGLRGDVQSVSVLRQLVKVIVTLENDEKEIREYKVSELKFKPRRKKEKLNINDEELKALEALEKKEGKSLLDDN